MAEAFVTNGAKVYISSRKASECESAVKTLDKIGKLSTRTKRFSLLDINIYLMVLITHYNIVPGQAKALPADISTEAGCKKLVEDFKKHENKLHFLINNAGTLY